MLWQLFILHLESSSGPFIILLVAILDLIQDYSFNCWSHISDTTYEPEDSYVLSGEGYRSHIWKFLNLRELH